MWSRSVCLFLIGLAIAAAQPSSESALERGLLLFSDGHFSEAEPLLRQAVATRPELFEARLALGATLARLKRSGQAIEQLQAAHHLRPAHLDALKLLAAQYIIDRQYVHATSLLLQVRARDEEVYLLLIQAYQASGDTNISFATAEEAAARFPSSAQINCWMGFQLQFSGRYEDARGYLEKALRLDAEYPATYYILGEALLKQQKARDSIPYFEKAVKLDPDDTDARMGLSQAWTGAGELPKALDILEAAEKSSPRNAHVHFLLSRLLFRLGNESRAQEEADLSLRYRGNEAEVPNIPAALRPDH
jgi:tetratricopeptide (TPR) repeat protein